MPTTMDAKKRLMQTGLFRTENDAVNFLIISNMDASSPIGAWTLKEKLNGVSQRHKFRIRYYNHDLSFIRLEKKISSFYDCRIITEFLYVLFEI